jgi:hypothetical protein
MRISAMSDTECKAAIAGIVSAFGDGRVKEGHYVFDAITRLPPGLVEKKLTTHELISTLKHYAQVLVVFDPNPRNTPFRLHLLHDLGIDEDVAGVKVAPEDLPRLLASSDCDSYVLAPDGSLLSVATHEDEIQGNERIMWCPVAS